MIRISAGECQREWGRVQDMAIAAPVAITSNGRDRMVLMSASEFARLKRRDREVLTLDDFTDEDIEAIRQTRAPEETKAFNHEVPQ